MDTKEMREAIRQKCCARNIHLAECGDCVLYDKVKKDCTINLMTATHDEIESAYNRILRADIHPPYNLDDYQRDAARTINRKLSGHQTLDHATWGMAAEVGELLSLHQKTLQGHPFDVDAAKKELGDIMWMVAEYATVQGWNLAEICQQNIEKLKKRYPEGFSEERSVNRDE